MRKYAIWISAVVVLLGVGYVWHRATAGWTPARVAREASAALPLGSTKREAEEWLRANDFSDIVSGPAIGLSYFETRDGISLEGATEVIEGEAPDPNVDLLCDGTITVFFFFGPDGRLVKVYVRPWICSL